MGTMSTVRELLGDIAREWTLLQARCNALKATIESEAAEFDAEVQVESNKGESTYLRDALYKQDGVYRMTDGEWRFSPTPIKELMRGKIISESQREEAEGLWIKFREGVRDTLSDMARSLREPVSDE